MSVTEQLTVGELAAASLAAVRVLEDHGIDYCCAGKRGLGEACRAQGLNFDALCLELEQAMQNNSPLEADWRQASLRDLIRHIVSTHHEYLRVELPRLSERLKTVLGAHGDKDPETLSSLSKIFSGLWEELDGHMQKEEFVLFPSIERMEAAVTAGQPLPRLPFGTIGNPISMMEREHDSAGLALRQMRETTRDYQLPEYACATYSALHEGLRELEANLHQHIHLENNILFPRAAQLEETRR